MNVLLKGLRWIDNGLLQSKDIRLRRGKIEAIDTALVATKNERVVSLTHHFLYPGLVNSHDHLEMNLYPKMGRPLYQNYTQWAKDIYKPEESPVKEIEAVPLRDRLLWGGLKNLLSGVTTAVHHNPWHRMMSKKDFPINVPKNYSWAHSLAFEKNVTGKFSVDSGKPFMIHLAEGIDELAGSEVQRLHQLGGLYDRSLLIHAVALSQQHIALIQKANATIVWCPSSNLFLFGKTADIGALSSKVNVLLGSDSTMTGPASLLDEMRVAVRTGLTSTNNVFEMVTSAPAKVFELPLGLRPGARADLLIAPALHNDYYENLLLQTTASLAGVIVNGEFRFGDGAIAEELALNLSVLPGKLSGKVIAMDIEGLRKRISTKIDSILATNSIWQVLGWDQ